MQKSLSEGCDKGLRATKSEEDDFVASLEVDLSDSLGEKSSSKSPHDDFFNDLENELSGAFSQEHGSRDKSSEEDFFSSLQEDLSHQMSKNRRFQKRKNRLAQPVVEDKTKIGLNLRLRFEGHAESTWFEGFWEKE